MRATTDHGEPCTDLITLNALHDSNRKLFYATLRHEQEHDSGGGFKVRGMMLMDFVTIARQPVARYSDKALTAFATEALAELRRRKDEDAVLAILTSKVPS